MSKAQLNNSGIEYSMSGKYVYGDIERVPPTLVESPASEMVTNVIPPSTALTRHIAIKPIHYQNFLSNGIENQINNWQILDPDS